MVASLVVQYWSFKFQPQSSTGSSPPLELAVTSSSEPAQMPNSPPGVVVEIVGGVTFNTSITMSKVVNAPSLSSATMVTVSMPATLAMKVPVNVAVEPLVTSNPWISFSPVKSSTSKVTVWVGSGPKNSTSRENSWPKQSVIVSQPKLAVGTGLKLLLVSAVLMLKNL